MNFCAAGYGEIGIAPTAMNWDYLSSKFTSLDDKIAFFIRFLMIRFVNLYHISSSLSKISFHKAFENSLKALAQAPRFFCKNSGTLDCFQTQLQNSMKKYKNEVRKFFFKAICSSGCEKSPQFLTVIEYKNLSL